MDEAWVAAGRMPGTQEQLRFTGRGGEYFRIWIVNLLLTIVTFGIYSAWAKVRRLQYFYRHTELAGSGFDFHGRPIRILVGCAVALVMVSVYNYTVRLHSVWTVVVLVVAAIILPWLLRNSLRFRLYNTSWRGTRFHFRGSLGGAYRVFLLNGLLTLVTLYGLAPFAHQRLKAYQHGNCWFGQTRFSFHAGVGKFYRAYLLVMAGLLVVAMVVGLAGIGHSLGAMVSSHNPGAPIDPKAAFRFIFVLWGAIFLVGLSIGPIFHAVITNLIWSNTRLGEHRIECRMSPLRLVWIGVSNLVLVVVTLGFFMPWAMVRSTRFQVESIRMLPASDLQEFVAAEPEAIGAVGEEAATIFDIDISL